jgi:hypothetical protein
LKFERFIVERYFPNLFKTNYEDEMKEEEEEEEEEVTMNFIAPGVHLRCNIFCFCSPRVASQLIVKKM